MPLSDERIGILVLKQLLQFIDLFCITMFYIEIWLKCASSSFKNFYKDSWNIFDLVITTLVLYIATPCSCYIHECPFYHQLHGINNFKHIVTCILLL